MDEIRYRQLVGDQAVTFEQRLHDAGAKIVLSAAESGWLAELTCGAHARVDANGDITLLTPRITVEAQAPMLSTALWLAARKAGLTEGLDPPANRPGSPKT